MLYYRRKILLALIEAFGGHLTAKQLQKYLFLFTRKQEEKAFDFIPYYYGCFSFQANQDIMTLAKLGYLSIIKSENGRRIQICQPNNYLMMLDMFEQQAIKEIKEKYPANRVEIDVKQDIESYIKELNLEIEIETNNNYVIKISDEEKAHKLLNKLVVNGINIDKFEIKKPTLNDIFIEKVGEC